MYSAKSGSLSAATTDRVPSGKEEFIDDETMEKRRTIIQQFAEKFLDEHPEAKKQLTPSVLLPLIDRLVYFGIYHAIIKEYYAQIDQQNKEFEKRKHFLRVNQYDPELIMKVTNYDKNILKAYDQMVEEQQQKLQNLRIPAFKVTTKTTDIATQQMILNLILEIDPENLYYTTSESGEIVF